MLLLLARAACNVLVDTHVNVRKMCACKNENTQVKERSTRTAARVAESGTLINNTKIPNIRSDIVEVEMPTDNEV